MPTGTATTHTDPEGLAEAVYGLPELYREAIPPARLIANPGCYTSTSILALAPLIAEDKIERTGDHHRRQERRLGRGAVAEADDSLPRVQRELLGLQRRPAPPHARDRPGADRRRPPAARRAGRGDLHAAPRPDGPRASSPRSTRRPRSRSSEHDLIDLYRAFYAGSPFVRVVDHLPATKDSAFTNFCDITAAGRPRQDRGPGLPRQPDQGRGGGGGAELQPDVRAPGDDGAVETAWPFGIPDRSIPSGLGFVRGEPATPAAARFSERNTS